MRKDLSKFANVAHIHTRKEIENYLLEPVAIDRALTRRIAEYNKRTDNNIEYNKKAEDILGYLTEVMKSKISGQFLSKRIDFEKAKNPGLDLATINQRLLEKFDEIWNNLSSRLELISGKEILSLLNKYLQEQYKITLSATAIISAMHQEEVPDEIRKLIEELDNFRKQ